MTSRAPSFAGRAYLAASIVAILLVLSVIAGAVLVYLQGGTIHGERRSIVWMLREDGPVETLTAILLGLAALFALIASFRVPDTLRWARPFLILFCVFSALMALEETSWGERLFDLEPGEFFQEHSDQNEINFHNVMQHYLKHHGFVVTKTRQIAAIVLLVYGVILPILNVSRRFDPGCGPAVWWCRRRRSSPAFCWAQSWLGSIGPPGARRNWASCCSV